VDFSVKHFFLLLFLILLPAKTTLATVEVGRIGQPPTTLNEVYLRDGTSYLSIEEVLSALNLKGTWDPVRHRYSFRTPAGTASISPGSPYLRLGERFIPLDVPPRFIDGYLRVSEDFVALRIPALLGSPIYYRNHQPQASPPVDSESSLDRLFAFLLHKSTPGKTGPALRAVALDPGHGGEDAGTISPRGDMEKTISLDVARRLERLLKMRMGIPVYMSRSGDYALTAEQRLRVAANPDVDALVLLHAQGALSPQTRGVTLVVRPQEEPESGSLVRGEGGSMRLARHLADSLQKSGFIVVGVLRAPLPHLGRGDLPTVMVELGFLTNPEDLAQLTSPTGREALSEALFTGLKNFADQEQREMNK
jgi:N-acetylmuramoyl-L-alanine amidase